MFVFAFSYAPVFPHVRRGDYLIRDSVPLLTGAEWTHMQTLTPPAPPMPLYQPAYVLSVLVRAHLIATNTVALCHRR